MTEHPQSLMTVREVAQFLNLSVGGTYQLVSQKRIPVTRLSSRCIRFRRSDLEQWIAGLTQPAETNAGLHRKPIPVSGNRQGPAGMACSLGRSLTVSQNTHAERAKEQGL